MPQPDDPPSGILWAAKKLRRFAATDAPGPPDPKQDRFLVEERQTKTLAVAVPELGAVPGANDRAMQGSSRDNSGRIVQPDNGVRASPRVLANHRIVAIGDPRFELRRAI